MHRWIGTASLLLLIAASAVAGATAPAVSVREDEAEVVRHILNRYLKHRGGQISTTLLLPVSINPSDLHSDLSAVARSGAPRDLVEKTRLSFAGEKMHFGVVRAPFAVATEHELKGIRTITSTGTDHWDWTRFRQHFPNSDGILEFSVPAFDGPRRVAVIYLRHLCGEHCGETYLYCLVRTSEGWVIATDLPLSAL